MSAIEALNKITERYPKFGKKINLSPDCKLLLKNADSINDGNVMEDLTSKVAVEII